MRDERTILHDELICYHTRLTLANASLGVGVSMSRLPRTGEIREIVPSLDLLCLRAFSKLKVRNSIDGKRFTHWLPLYFGETTKFTIKH